LFAFFVSFARHTSAHAPGGSTFAY